MQQRPDLGSILVAKKIATSHKIDQARRGHADLPLWRALIAAEVVNDLTMFEALRDHSNIPLVPEALLEHGVPVEKLTLLLGKEDALRAGILPLELSADGRRVQLAMVDPTDEKSLRSLAQGAGFQSAKVFLIAPALFTAAVERLYSGGRAQVEPAGKVGRRSEQEASERLEQVLVQATLSLGAALEAELGRHRPPSRDGGAPPLPSAREAARLARELSRELGHDRRQVALAGLAAQLVQLDQLRRSRAEDEPSLFEELGWAAGGDDGLLGISRALTATTDGFGKPPNAGAMQRVVQAVLDYLGLATTDADLDAVAQLLRTSSAGAPVIDALLRVLRRELSDRTPAAATELPEQSGPRSDITNVRRAPARSRSDDHTQLVSLPEGGSSREVKR